MLNIFGLCSGLISIEIPNSVTNIGQGAFYDCTSLNSIISEIQDPFEIHAFSSSTYEKATLYVPAESLELYQSTSGWNEFVNIVELGLSLTLIITDEYDADITEKVGVVWYDADGKQIGTGNKLNGIEDSTEVYYSILLDEKLGRVYREVKKQKIVVGKENETVTSKLQRIEEVTLHGTVQAYGMVIPRAEVSLTQWLNGKYEYTAETKTDANGEFTLIAYNDSTELYIAADGYTDETITHKMLGTNGELGTVEMQQVRGKVVALQLSYQEAVREGEEPLVQNWYSDTRNIDYSVRNLTKETDITDFAMQQGDIVLPTGAEQGDRIRVTLRSMNDKFAEVSGESTIAENDTALIVLQLKAYGGIEVYCNQKADEQISFMLYDSEGKLIKSNATSSSQTTLTGLKAGSYTLVVMGYNNNVGTIGNLSDFDLFGLSEGSDYVKTTVTISDGIIGSVTINNVPELDMSKFEYTAANTSYLPNKTEMTVNGSFVTLTARVDFKTLYVNEVSDVKLLIDIPEGCEFIPNSVVSGTKPLVHSLNGNLLTITLNSEDIDSRIRFCMKPRQLGIFTSTAYAEFNCNGAKQQSIGLAVFEATAGPIVVPSVTDSKTIPVNGIAAPHATVDIYDNDHLIGTTTALGDGKWRTEVDLYQSYNLSIHKINAKYQTYNGVNVTTESQECYYDISQVKARSVTMIYNGNNIVFDYDHLTVTPNHYSFVPGRLSFTFMADLTPNDTAIVNGVTFFVHTIQKEVRKLKGFFDENLSRWVAIGEFDSYSLPVNVSVEVEVNTENSVALADRRYVSDKLDEIAVIFENTKKNTKEISNILSNVDTHFANEDLYQQLENLLLTDNYDEEKVNDLVEEIFNNIPISDEYIDDERIEQLRDSFDIVQADFEEWWAQRLSSDRDTLYSSAMIDLGILNAELPKIPYSGTATNEGTTFNYSINIIEHLDEESMLSQGYYVVNMTDNTKIFCKITDTNVVLVDEGKMMSCTLEFVETKVAMSRANTAINENFKQAFNNFIQNYREGTRYANNYQDWLSTTNTLTQLSNMIAKTYSTQYDILDFRIKQAFNVDEIDSRIALEEERLREWNAHIRKKYNGMKVFDMRDIGHQRLIEWNIARLNGERNAILNAYEIAVIPLRRYPRTLNSSVTRLNNVMRALGRIGGCISVLIDLIELYVDVQELIVEDNSWNHWSFIAENNKPCDGDKAKLEEIISQINADHRDYRNNYIAMLLGRGATTALDIAQLNPMVGLGCYVASVWTGLITEVYKVVRFDNGEFINRKSKIQQAIQKLKCKKNEEPDKEEPNNDKTTPSPSQNKTIPKKEAPAPQIQNVTPMIDPSGYVYEAVPTNRLEGVTATIYFDEEHPTQWDAADFSQVNPQITDDTGLYQWDVPQGMWQVRFEKEGYETTQTDWLPVPPPQLEINIPMSEAVAPTVVKARGTESGITLDFSKYMKPTTLEKNGRVSVTVNGKSASGDVEMMNLEEDPYNQKEYASKVKFVPNKAFSTTDEVIITVKKEVESYASKQMEADFVQRVKIEPELTAIVCDSLLVVDYRDAKTLEVQVLPASASKGKTLQVVSTSPMIASTGQQEVILDQDGKAVITVSGSLPGSGAIKLSIPEADMTRYVDVSVTVKETVVKMPKASKRSGSVVEPGYQLTLTCSTPGATIYYTLDGTCPCDEQKRIKYTSPITLPLGHITLKAVAVRDGMDDSDIVTYEYDVQKDGESGVQTIKEGFGIDVSYQDGSIVVSGAKGGDCHIYDLQGRELASRSKLSNHTRINVPKNDVYIVSVSYGNDQKVVCKVMNQ